MALTDPVVLIATVTAVIQVIVLFLLIYGYILKNKQKYAQHGKIMASAVIIHAVTIILVMIPSLIIITSPNYVLPEPRTLLYTTSIAHAAAGAIAFVLGTWLVLAWRFKDIKGCFTRKRIMDITISLWIVALLLGIYLYVITYGTQLFS
ncbi:MAG: hypothetical protein ACQCN6_14535 [Candidatus Bathyarchaeia archaeon]|jgi:uncharacterized membrane protein YozB (DUF420 family)